MRVRGFTQDDAHIFCRPDQLEDEIFQVLDFTLFMLRTFGFQSTTYTSRHSRRSTSARRRTGTAATGALKRRSRSKGLAYKVDPGEGVFYGPKIDIKIKDALGRAWQCTTIQVDFNLPERFDVEYIGEDGNAAPADHGAPRAAGLAGAVLRRAHRALRGRVPGLARAGAGGDLHDHRQAGRSTRRRPWRRCAPRASGRRRTSRNEKIGYKIREATLQKVPYILVVGDKEVEGGHGRREASGRAKTSGPMPTAEFIRKVIEEIKEKSL